MKQLLPFFTLTFLCMCITACKKDKQDKAAPVEETPAPIVTSGYSQLKTGNYWIYTSFMTDANGVATDLHQYDSSYVEKDTLIRGQVYFKLYRTYQYGPQVFYLRDSLNYIVNSFGRIMFASEDFTTVFADFYAVVGVETGMPDTLYRIRNKMNDRDLMVTVPAGAFKTSAMQSEYTTDARHQVLGISNPRSTYARYTKNVGLVYETEQFFSASAIVRDKRLVRYHVN